MNINSLNPHPDATVLEPVPSRSVAGFRSRILCVGENPENLRGGVADLLRIGEADGKRYFAAYAATPRAIRAAQRLRFEVFNLELNEGLSESLISGLDRDEYDEPMTQLVVVDTESNEIVGTYRLQTVSRGASALGLYSAREFDVRDLALLEGEAVECGRACIAPDHRNLSTLMTLWGGIGDFMRRTGAQWLFGCCSITTTSPDDGWRAMKTIRRLKYQHDNMMIRAQREYTCGDPAREFEAEVGNGIPLPKLFKTYMRLGSKVISEPAIDREFGTVDFLILMKADDITMSSLAMD